MATYDSSTDNFFYNKPEDVWSIDCFDVLLDAIEKGDSIDKVLKLRHESCMSHISDIKSNMISDMKEQHWYQEMEKEKGSIKKYEDLLESLEEVKKRLTEYEKEQEEIKNIIESIDRRLTYLGSDYYKLRDGYELKTGTFDKISFARLKENVTKAVISANIVKRIFLNKKLTKLFDKLDKFVQKYYTNDNLYKLVHDNEALSNLGSGYYFSNYLSKIEELKLDCSYKIGSAKVRLDSYLDTKKIQEKPIMNMEKECKERMAKEDQFIREFVDNIANNILHPKDIKCSDWVERLESMSDDEMVMFDILTSSRISFRSSQMVKNVLKYNCISIGDSEKDWLWDRGYFLYGSDQVELFSPIMRVKDAKKIVPKLVADLYDAGVARNLVVAMHPNELLCKNKSVKNNLNDSVFVIMDAIKDGRVSSMDASQLYPNKEYLFNGTMLSDDYKFLSPTEGRCGISYASRYIRNAFGYTAMNWSEVPMRRRESVCGVYYEPYELSYQGKAVHVGFINVYEKNMNDRFFWDLGIENYLTPNGKRYFKTYENYEDYDVNRGEPVETYVTPEKNRLVDKLVCFAWCGKLFLLPKNQKYPDDVKDALNEVIDAMAGDMERILHSDSFDFSKRLKRFKQQRADYERGFVPEDETLKKQDERRKKLEKIHENNVMSDKSFDNSNLLLQNLQRI
jgi:hypothetical protein